MNLEEIVLETVRGVIKRTFAEQGIPYAQENETDELGLLCQARCCEFIHGARTAAEMLICNDGGLTPQEVSKAYTELGYRLGLKPL